MMNATRDLTNSVQVQAMKEADQGSLAAFPFVDQHCDLDQRERDDHPVLKRNAQKGDLLEQPIVHGIPDTLRKPVRKS